MMFWLRNGLLITLATLVFSACSGGGSSAPAQQPAQQGSGDWDQLVWDQDNWK